MLHISIPLLSHQYQIMLAGHLESWVFSSQQWNIHSVFLSIYTLGKEQPMDPDPI